MESFNETIKHFSCETKNERRTIYCNASNRLLLNTLHTCESSVKLKKKNCYLTKRKGEKTHKCFNHQQKHILFLDLNI